MKVFFLEAFFAMITKKMTFSILIVTIFRENKFSQENIAIYQSKQHLKKCCQTDKKSSRFCQKGICPLRHRNDKNRSNRIKAHKKVFLWLFINVCHIS